MRCIGLQTYPISTRYFRRTLFSLRGSFYVFGEGSTKCTRDGRERVGFSPRGLEPRLLNKADRPLYCPAGCTRKPKPAHCPIRPARSPPARYLAKRSACSVRTAPGRNLFCNRSSSARRPTKPRRRPLSPARHLSGRGSRHKQDVDDDISDLLSLGGWPNPAHSPQGRATIVKEAHPPATETCYAFRSSRPPSMMMCRPHHRQGVSTAPATPRRQRTISPRSSLEVIDGPALCEVNTPI